MWCEAKFSAAWKQPHIQSTALQTAHVQGDISTAWKITPPLTHFTLAQYNAHPAAQGSAGISERKKESWDWLNFHPHADSANQIEASTHFWYVKFKQEEDNNAIIYNWWKQKKPWKETVAVMFPEL